MKSAHKFPVLRGRRLSIDVVAEAKGIKRPHELLVVGVADLARRFSFLPCLNCNRGAVANAAGNVIDVLALRPEISRQHIPGQKRGKMADVQGPFAYATRRLSNFPHTFPSFRQSKAVTVQKPTKKPYLRNVLFRGREQRFVLPPQIRPGLAERAL
jgi:hypothetical protein